MNFLFLFNDLSIICYSKANANLSELIYNILTNKKYIEREMPILFVLNKQDLINARKQNVIEEEIINEM